MTSLPELLDRTSMAEIVSATGGPQLRNNRGPMWFDGDDNPNSRAFSIDEDKGCWFSFRDHTGGGKLDLIQRALGCGKSAAVQWLCDLRGETLAPVDQQQIENRKRAEQEARDLLEWRDRMVLVIRAVRNAILSDCGRLERWATAQGSFTDSPLWHNVAEVPDRLRIADGLDDYLVTLCAFSASELTTLRRRLERGQRAAA